MVDLRPRPPKHDNANAQRRRDTSARVVKSPKKRTNKTSRINNTTRRAQEEDIGDNIVVAPRNRMMQPMQPMQQPMQQQAHAAAAGGAQNQAQEDSDIGDNIVVAQRVMVNGRWVFAAAAPELAAGEREQNIRRAEVMEANVVGYPGADDGQRMRGHTVPDVAMGGDAEADELAEDEMDLAIEQDTHTAEMTATEENAAEHAVDQNEIDWAQDTVSLAQQVTQAAGAVNIGNGALPALHTPAAQHNAGPAQDVPTGRPGRSVVSAETRRQESLGDARNRSTNWHIMTASALRRTPPPPAPPSSPGLPTPPPPPPPQPRPEPRTCACCVADFGVVTVNDRGHYHVEAELAEWYCKKCHFMVHKECQQMWLLNAIQRNHAGSCLNCNQTQDWSGFTDVVYDAALMGRP